MNKVLPTIVGTGAVLLLFLGTFLIARNAYAVGAFPYATGGTGTTTPNPGQLVWWGTANQKGVATTSVTCTGGTTCTTFTAIGASPITINSSAASGSAYPFTPGTFGSTNTSATSTAINDTAGFISTASSTLFNLTSLFSTSTNATTTNFAITGAPAVNCNGTNALTTSASGNVTCTAQPQGTVTSLTVVTNQGVSGSFSASATPALTLTLGALTGVTSFNGLVVTANTGTITTGTWNGTTIAVANGGTGAVTLTGCLTGNGTGAITGSGTCSTFGYPFVYATTFNTLSAGTSTPLWLQGSPYSLFASSTSIIDYATSTAFTVNSALYIPNASTPTLGTTAGRVAINTSAASTSVQFYGNSAQNGLYNLTPRGTSFLNPAGYSATTTIAIPTGPRGTTITQGYCQSAGGGSFTGVFGKGTSTTTYMQSSNSGSNPTVTTISSNNTLEAFQTYYVQVGSWSQTTATTTGSCVWSGYYTY